MKQFNLTVSSEFARDLKEYMKFRGLSKKSDAIRLAIREAVERLHANQKKTDCRKWIGLALNSPANPTPQFPDEDSLWS